MIILLLAIIGLIVWNSFLSSRISELENKILQRNFYPEKDELKNQNTAPEKPEVIFEKPVEKKSTENFREKNIQTIEPPKKEKKPPTKNFSWEDFFGRKFFAILGILSLVCAIGFFSTWAFSHGIIGPKGRIVIGILFSLILLIVAELLRNKYPKFFDIISSAGIAGLVVTTFIARNYNFENYSENLITAQQSFIFYILEISVGIFLSLRYKSRVLANFSIIGGLLSPILMNSPSNNAIGLLWFLSILAIAGFIISIRQRWPEILGILFLGIIIFEGAIFADSELKNSPVIFLNFVFFLHYLLGSGGIIRSIKEKISQDNFFKLSSQSIFEVILFVTSVLAANILGAGIFDQQVSLINQLDLVVKNETNNFYELIIWQHFGFFVLIQGFILFFISNVLKKFKLELFQKILLLGTMVSIVFATIWEIDTKNIFILTMFLVAEGLLFCFAGNKISEKFFQIFGRLTILLAFVFSWEISMYDFWEKTFTMLFLVGAFIYSIHKPTKIWEKIWAGSSIFFATINILNWSFEPLSMLLSANIKFLVFIIPVLWASSIAFSVLKTKSDLSRIFGLIIMGLINLILFNTWLRPSSLLYVPFVSMIIVFIGHFTVLSSFFIKNIKTLDITKKIATILILASTTLTILLFGGEFLDEPIRTIFWIIWGVTLLSFGFKFLWPHFRYFGIGMLLFIIAKIYFVDVWQWAIWIRFFAFLVLGIVLLGISFFYQKKRGDS